MSSATASTSAGLNVIASHINSEEHLQAYISLIATQKVLFTHKVKDASDFAFLVAYTHSLNMHGATRLAYIERLYLRAKYDINTALKMLRNYLYILHADYHNRYTAYSVHFPYVYVLSAAVTVQGISYRHSPKQIEKHNAVWTQILTQNEMLAGKRPDFKI